MSYVYAVCLLLLSFGASASIVHVSKVSTNNAIQGPIFTVDWQVVPGFDGTNNSFFTHVGIAAFPCYSECSGVQGWMAYPQILDWSHFPGANYQPIPWDIWVERFRNEFGASGRTTITTNTNGTGAGWVVCFAGRIGSLQLYPLPGTCSSITSVPNTCDWDVTSGSINHGSINTANVNGHEAEVTARFKCTQPSSVRVRFLNNNIYLGNNINTRLTANGSSSSNFSVNGNTLTPVTLRSKLQTVGTIAGNFSGNAVAIIELQ